jgi:hypothetical protein
MTFCTNIENTNIKRIITFSDIHADIDSLIINLRDCGNVIKTKQEFDLNVRDEQLENLLNIDLNTNESDYRVNLNYEWCGGDTYVVIIGDILDGIRSNTPIFNNRPINYYPQLEIKIIKFLNFLDDEAKKTGGRVIKLIGNHELENFKGNDELINTYAFSEDLEKDNNYYKGKSRLEYFNFGNEGFNLYKHGGTGVLLKINNNIFVHGRITNFNLKVYTEINDYINTINTTTDFTNTKNLNYRLFNYFINLKRESPLWGRKYGDESKIHDRFDNNKKFCEEVQTNLVNFCKSIENCNSLNLRIIIGHCPQNYSSWFDKENKTFSKITNFDNIEVIEGPIHSGKIDLAKNIIFGISMECDKKDQLSDSDKSIIYRVDTGSSRAFDKEEVYLSNPENSLDTDKLSKQYYEKKMLFSRTPQILEIMDNNIKIIRSKMRNTRIHQPRPTYEKLIEQNPELSLENTYYKKKYLKYKSKYFYIKF